MECSEAHFLVNKDLVLVLGLPERNKCAWKRIIRKAVKAESPAAYAVITPIWLAEATKGTEDLLPSAHPFREEGILITAYSPFKKIAAFIGYNRLTPKLVEVKAPEVWRYFTDSLVGNVYRSLDKNRKR
jgi:hypothetical protein